MQAMPVQGLTMVHKAGFPKYNWLHSSTIGLFKRKMLLTLTTTWFATACALVRMRRSCRGVMAKPLAVHLVCACICQGWLKLGLQVERERNERRKEGDVGMLFKLGGGEAVVGTARASTACACE